MNSDSYSPRQVLNRALDVPTNAIRVSGAGFFAPPAAVDSVTFEYPSDTVEVVRYRDGGASGTILMTLTLTYTDDSKAQLLSVERT